MKVTELLAIALGAILTNNFIFSQFLGICPFYGRVQEDRHRCRYGRSRDLRDGSGLRPVLPRQ